MNRFVLSIGMLFLFATAMASERYIRISSPTEGTVIDPAVPVTVSGTGKGLFEGNVVIRFEGVDGKLLVQKPTTMHRQDIAAAGKWQTSISLPAPVPELVWLIAFSPSPKDGEAAITSTPVMLVTGLLEDQAAMQLGRRVAAVRKAIQYPDAPRSLEAITDLGHDQRYYVMVRGWLAFQLQGDMSIVEASRGQVPEHVSARIRFLNRAIRAIDLE